MKIGVIGVGKLGLCFALLCEKNGFEVYGSDINSDYCEKIKSKTLITNEPELDILLKKYNKFYVMNDNIKVIEKSDVIFTFVQTPSNEDGGYNHINIDNIITEFEFLTKKIDLSNKIFVVGSTTMPNYVSGISEKLNKFGVRVCYNPEFIAQGEIIKGLEYADMVLIGADSDFASDKLKEIYRKIMKVDPTFNVMSTTAAEITKISINCYLTTKISFANMIGEISNNSGVIDETNSILKAIGDDTRIGNKYLKFGYGFGGPCLPRDNRALGKHIQNIGLKINLPYEIDKFNEEHNEFLFRKLISINPDKNKIFVFNYVSYKKGTDIFTESQQLRLLIKLLDNGYTVKIDDEENIVKKVEDILNPIFGNIELKFDKKSIDFLEVNF